MAHVRAGRQRRYIERAEAMAASRGLTPTPAQIAKAAEALRLADLAEMRLRAWEELQGSNSVVSLTTRTQRRIKAADPNPTYGCEE